jgi:cell division septation protein DedD
MTITPPQIALKDKKRIPLVWIPATLSIGLLIAAIYLGGRIVAAHRPAQATARTTNGVPPAAPPRPSVVAQPLVAAAAKPEVEPERSATVATDDAIPMIAPHGGERYIQLGAYNLEATRRFVQHLRGEKLEPRVAPGPKPEILRVLIGPFDNRDALDRKKAQLQTEGFDTFVREY